MELRLKQMFGGHGTVFQQIHKLAKTWTVQPTRCNSHKSDVSSHFRLYKQMGKRCLHPPREMAAATTLLMRSPAFTNIVNSQVQHLRQFHSSALKFVKESQRQSSASRPDQDRQQNDHNEDDEDKQRSDAERSLIATALMLVGFSLLAVSKMLHDQKNQKWISWNEFYHNILLAGEVKSIRLWVHHDDEDSDDLAFIQVHEGAIIKGHPVSPHTEYIIKIPRGFNFEEKLREVEDQMGVTMKDRLPIEYGDSSAMSRYLGLSFMVLVGSVAFMMMNRYGKSMGKIDMDSIFKGIRQAKFTRMDKAVRGSKVKAISFKDVAGLKEAKVEITEFVDYLTNPSRYQTLGAKTPRGALLLGPPGCGKTLLALALATEAKVPFLAMAGSEFVEMIGGVGAARVRSLFKEARARAPCIVYIDEIDAIGRSRGGSSAGGRGEDEHTLNQLLVEMDGMGTQEGVIMIAATNRPDILDKALLRPGRFDRHIMIDLPTLQEREEIFMVYLNKLKLAQAAKVYAKPLSKLTPGMSGADINNICNEAAIHAARDSNKVIDTKNFEYAIERALAGVEKRTSQLSPTEKKVVAFHEAGHALVGWLLKHTDALLRISILPRTNNALGFTQYLPSDQRLYSKEELFERMCMALGGRAAESLVFNHVSTAAHDDLNRVTEMAYNQIRSYGMNERVGHVSFPSEKEQQGVKPYSQKLAQIMDEEARRLVAKAFLQTQAVLQENRDKLNKLATTLLEKEALTYEDVEALIGPPPHGKKNTIEPEGWRAVEEDTPQPSRPSKTSSRHKRK